MMGVSPRAAFGAVFVSISLVSSSSAAPQAGLYGLANWQASGYQFARYYENGTNATLSLPSKYYDIPADSLDDLDEKVSSICNCKTTVHVFVGQHA